MDTDSDQPQERMQGVGNSIFIVALRLITDLTEQFRIGIPHADAVRKTGQHFQIIPVIAEHRDFFRFQIQQAAQAINTFEFACLAICDLQHLALIGQIDVHLIPAYRAYSDLSATRAEQ